MKPVIHNEHGQPLGFGLVERDGRVRVWGTYMHGVFDSDAFRHAFLNEIRCAAGMKPMLGARYNLGAELDRLADTVIYKLLLL
jgi:adenosylcobyric acid synthase